MRKRYGELINLDLCRSYAHHRADRLHLIHASYLTSLCLFTMSLIQHAFKLMSTILSRSVCFGILPKCSTSCHCFPYWNQSLNRSSAFHKLEPWPIFFPSRVDHPLFLLASTDSFCTFFVPIFFSSLKTLTGCEYFLGGGF